MAEITLSVLFYYRDSRNTSDYRIYADVYKNETWAQKYFQEFHEGTAQWTPYVYWRRKSYQGQYINVNSDGFRKTWNPNSQNYLDISCPLKKNNQPKTIFVFGGSTIWGTGARDEFTIPSILSKLLNQNAIDVQVVNLGESGYVSTQEVILLIQKLQEGCIPDLVIFYDGANDLSITHKSECLLQNKKSDTVFDILCNLKIRCNHISRN